MFDLIVADTKGQADSAAEKQGWKKTSDLGWYAGPDGTVKYKNSTSQPRNVPHGITVYMTDCNEVNKATWTFCDWLRAQAHVGRIKLVYL